MYGFGRQMIRRYPPSQEFSDELDKKREEWDGFVTSIGTTCVYDITCTLMYLSVSNTCLYTPN